MALEPFELFRRHPWEVAALLGSVTLVSTLLRRQQIRWRKQTGPEPVGGEAALNATDPGLLAKYSTFKSYTTSKATYPSIRTFFKPHSQEGQLPKNPPLPLLVFLHGLGGSFSQFHLLLTSLVNVGPCLGIDLPGCGLSRFAPNQWDAYSYEALVELWSVAIEVHCDVAAGQQIVLIGHSMGCFFSQTLASRSSNENGQSRSPFRVAGIAAICPGAHVLTRSEKAIFGTLLSIPTPIFDLWRAWDRRGGIASQSVTRFVGKAADPQTRELQLRYNSQSQTAVWRRVAWGLVTGSTPDVTAWAALPSEIRILLIGAEDDPVTPVKGIQKIREAIESSSDQKYINVTILPGSHALPYDHNNYRSVSGLIQTFLAEIDSRLSLGWQLQYLATEGKWDVKNLRKWQAVVPVSDAIGGKHAAPPVFRAIKTLREIDDTHSPSQFVRRWRDKIAAVIDISHDTPVYDPKNLQDGGIEYHKFPTVSKYPPEEQEVKGFIALADKLRAEIENDERKGETEARQIGVHCHYGFNRTGFFICAYLIEKEGYTVQEAINEFAEKRPPGIRHSHFLDTMYVRYAAKRTS